MHDACAQLSCSLGLSYTDDVSPKDLLYGYIQRCGDGATEGRGAEQLLPHIVPTAQLQWPVGKKAASLPGVVFPCQAHELTSISTFNINSTDEGQCGILRPPSVAADCNTNRKTPMGHDAAFFPTSGVRSDTYNSCRGCIYEPLPR